MKSQAPIRTSRITAPWLRSIRGWILLSTLLLAGACRKPVPAVSPPPSRAGDRPSHLVPLDPDAILEVTWRQPDRLVSWQKIDGHWYFAGMEAIDDQAMRQYLESLTALTAFARPHARPVGLPVGDQLILALGRSSGPLVLTVYPVRPGTALMFHSTAMSDQYFLSDSLGMYARIFTALQRLRPDEQ